VVCNTVAGNEGSGGTRLYEFHLSGDVYHANRISRDSALGFDNADNTVGQLDHVAANPWRAVIDELASV
jgi:hypothetical protein